MTFSAVFDFLFFPNNLLSIDIKTINIADIYIFYLFNDNGLLANDFMFCKSWVIFLNLEFLSYLLQSCSIISSSPFHFCSNSNSREIQLPEKTGKTITISSILTIWKLGFRTKFKEKRMEQKTILKVYEPSNYWQSPLCHP